MRVITSLFVILVVNPVNAQLMHSKECIVNNTSSMFEWLSKPAIGNAIQFIILLAQILLIWFGLNQFRKNIKLNRRGIIYNGFIDIEEKINEKNKGIWGLSKDDKFTDSAGNEYTYTLDEIKHMVQLIDLFAFERGQTNKYEYKPLPKTNVLYKMLQNEKHIKYWEYVVKPTFFDESRFSIVIDRTIMEIRLKHHIINGEE